jgi:hypothetical protein
MFPTKAALAYDDLAYPHSWEGEHFPVSLGQHAEDGSPQRNGVHGAKKSAKAGKAAKGKAVKAGKAAKAPRRNATVESTWQ